jgi:galactonate dehydratase
MTGRDVFVRIETDAGIVGYGDATNHFLPFSVEGMLKDLAPYVIGEDPQRIEYLWQSCFRRRFQLGGPSIGSAIAGIDQALWDIKGKLAGISITGRSGSYLCKSLWTCVRDDGGRSC